MRKKRFVKRFFLTRRDLSVFFFLRSDSGPFNTYFIAERTTRSAVLNARS